MLNAFVDRTRQIEPDQPQGASLRVVPILGPDHAEPRYQVLGPENLHAVEVSEISDSGQVSTLRVVNRLPVSVFLMDGQELRGAKQNRMLNTDVLVPAESTIQIPVSCVEAGRWRHSGQMFSPGKAAPHRTRSGKMARVHESLKRSGAHDADQSAVWAEVDASLADAEALSATRALSAAYARRESEMGQFRGSLRLPERAVGVAVFHGASFQGLDLFDRHTTLKAFWDSLVDSYSIDFLDTPIDLSAPAERVQGQTVRDVLNHASSAVWESFSSPGDGKDWRFSDDRFSGAALVWDERVVIHVQLYPRASATPKRRSLKMRRSGLFE